MEVVTGLLAADAGGVACVFCVFPVAAVGFTGVAPALADGVGVGDGLFPAGCWPLELVLCAVAMLTMNVASARIRMSFISVPFVCGLTTNPLYFFTGAAGAAGAAG